MEAAGIAEFIAAVQSGDRGKAAAMLAARPELAHLDVSASDEHRALHYAVLQRDRDMVRLLLAAGADPHKGIWPHRDATSALILAQDRGFPEIVGATEGSESRQEPANTPSPAAATEADPLAAAVMSGDRACVEELLRSRPDRLHRIGREGGLLTLAAKHGQAAIAKLLLDLGADADERVLLPELEAPTWSWGTPLWHAALLNHYEIAELLLERGADPNANVYASGWPLRNAWHHADGRIKRLLLARGARRQPYMVAEEHDVAEARRLLATEGSEELAKELAWSAADHGCAEIVELALPHLAWPRSDPRWHWVLIQPIRGAGESSAASSGHLAGMAAILRHGVDPNVTRFGAAALHFCAGRQGLINDADRARFASLLINAGARLDLRDDLLQATPLGWACRWGRGELIQTLIAHGAPVDEPDAEAWAAPRAWAARYGHERLLPPSG